MSYGPPTEFKRKAVDPVVCIKAGWNLVRDQYWLFVGIVFIGLILASMVPMAILLGPMMCGIYLGIFRRLRGEPVELGTLFQGFDYFGPSLIATLLHILPMIAMLLPLYVVILLAPLLMIPLQHNGEADTATLLVFIAIFAVMGIVIVILIVLLNIVFTFAYPLIVDRKLSGGEAVKLSAKAAFANFWQILCLMLLNGLLVFAGALLCYVGIFLVMPLSFAALAIAYTQVFGLGNTQSPGPPPPPRFN
jgi:uncharacterized membrane protein